jgi:hypothetical protein
VHTLETICAATRHVFPVGCRRQRRRVLERSTVGPTAQVTAGEERHDANGRRFIVKEAGPGHNRLLRLLLMR